MVSITADLMQALLHLSDPGDIDNTNMEYIIDYAVNRLNNYLKRYDYSISNMTGTTGSKTLELPSEDAGAVQEATRLAYYACYKNPDNVTLQGMSVVSPNMLSNPQFETAIQKLAENLMEMDVSVV